MVELEPKNTADFINSEFFKSNPKEANDFLNSALDIMEEDLSMEGDIIQTMQIIEDLGDCISADLFNANPILGNKTLTIFRKGLNHKENGIRLYTRDKIGKILKDVIVGNRTNLNEEILNKLAFGSDTSSYSQDVVLIAKRVSELDI